VRIKVEATWNGHRHGFLLTLPNGSREQITAVHWDRDARKCALNLLENLYGFKRRNVRFNVR
jgi:hypothetical protein